MQILKFFFLFSTIATLTTAQQLRQEVPSRSSPIDDLKPNNDSVPSVYSLHGQFDQILVLRLKYQADLLAGLESIVKEKRVRNAVILSGIGSVCNYHFHTISNRNFPTKNIYVKDTTTSANITSMNGYVIDGRVHAHITFSNEEEAFGGHLEYGTNVFTFAIVTIGVLNDGIDLRRVDDKNYR